MSDFRDVKGKVAIVTGAARGIGFSTAETLASEGIHVVMSDILPNLDESCEKVSEAYPDVQVYAKAADVSDEAAVKALVDFTLEKFGKLDIMVNNAGMHMDTGNVWETDMAKVDKIMGVNFKGEFHGCKYAAQQMIKQKSGTIVNIGSFFGKVGHAGSATYGASKGAIHTMTQALALELAPYQVNVLNSPQAQFWEVVVSDIGPSLSSFIALFLVAEKQQAHRRPFEFLASLP